MKFFIEIYVDLWCPRWTFVFVQLSIVIMWVGENDISFIIIIIHFVRIIYQIVKFDVSIIFLFQNCSMGIVSKDQDFTIYADNDIAQYVSSTDCSISWNTLF